MLPDSHRCTAGKDADSKKQEVDCLFLVLREDHRFRFSLKQWAHSLRASLIPGDTDTHSNADMTNEHFDTRKLTRSLWFANKLWWGLWIYWVSHPYYRHIASGGPLNVRFTLFNGEFHAHLLNWPKCIVWLCLIRQTAGFSPCGYIVPASLLLGFADMLRFSLFFFFPATSPFWE